MAAKGKAQRERRMVVGSRSESSVRLFTDEEVSEIYGLKRGPDYIEVSCGCTSRKYGDAVGRLRVFATGALEIACDCYPGCQEEKLSPAEFEKHSLREGARKWKSNVWVNMNGKKIPLWRTVLLKYYNETAREADDGSLGSRRRRRNFHRDEFIHCSTCNKERRFRLRNEEECRIFHDALADECWTCADFPYDNITCEDEEERGSRKVCRSCPRAPTCGGCTSCVCFGCRQCRFSDCGCRSCADFNHS